MGYLFRSGFLHHHIVMGGGGLMVRELVAMQDAAQTLVGVIVALHDAVPLIHRIHYRRYAYLHGCHLLPMMVSEMPDADSFTRRMKLFTHRMVSFTHRAHSFTHRMASFTHRALSFTHKNMESCMLQMARWPLSAWYFAALG